MFKMTSRFSQYPSLQQISSAEFADRFTQINELYLAESQRISKNLRMAYRIFGVIVAASVVLIVFGVLELVKTKASLLLLIAFGLGFTTCGIWMGTVIYFANNKIHKVHVCYVV